MTPLALLLVVHYTITKKLFTTRRLDELDGTAEAATTGVPLGVYSGDDGRCVNMGQWSRRLTTDCVAAHNYCAPLCFLPQIHINKSFSTWSSTSSHYSPLPLFSHNTLSSSLFSTLHASL